MMRRGESIFEDLRAQWEQEIGPANLRKLEDLLARLVGPAPARLEAPGWIAQDPTYRDQVDPGAR